MKALEKMVERHATAITEVRHKTTDTIDELVAQALGIIERGGMSEPLTDRAEITIACCNGSGLAAHAGSPGTSLRSSFQKPTPRSSE
jgi:hypothetical protein